MTLLYHGISEVWDDELAVRPASLDAQVRMAIGRGYVPASADDVLGATGKVLHLTFDDAFRNIRPTVLELTARGVPVTVFACPGLGSGEILNVERLVGSGAESERETMDWDELLELSAAGVEIGSHTVTHARLTRLSDAELRDELCGSKEMLEATLGRPCHFLAYPFGDHDARVRAAVRAAGYTAAFATTGRHGPFDPFAVPRAAFYRSDSTLKSALKISALGQLVAQHRESLRERHSRVLSSDP